MLQTFCVVLSADYRTFVSMLFATEEIGKRFTTSQLDSRRLSTSKPQRDIISETTSHDTTTRATLGEERLVPMEDLLCVMMHFLMICWLTGLRT